MNVLEKMNQSKVSFTSSDKKIYTTISKNPELVQNYTITQIAKFAGVSTSAMLRFCKRLNYNGFKDFKFDVELFLRTKADDNRDTNPLNKIALAFSEAILALPKECETELQELSAHIINSDKIIAFGRYRNKSVAQKLFTNLTNLGLTCITASDSLTYENLEKIITKDTTVIVFSVMHDISDYQDVIYNISGFTDKLWLITFNKNKLKNLGFNHYVVLPSAVDASSATDQHTIMFAFIEMLSYMLRHNNR